MHGLAAYAALKKRGRLGLLGRALDLLHLQSHLRQSADLTLAMREREREVAREDTLDRDPVRARGGGDAMSPTDCTMP